MKRTKNVSLNDTVFKIVNALATKRELSVSEAAEHLIKVGDTRIRTLAKHTARRTKERKAARKVKKQVAKVIPIAPEGESNNES